MTRVCALRFMFSVICTELRPIKERFVSRAVRLTEAKGSVCLNDFRYPKEIHGIVSAFVAKSTQGKGF